MSFSFPPNSVSGSSFTRTEALVTPEQIKSRYLFGIDLTDDNGNELPAETIQHAIDTAVSFLEHKLDIIIYPTEFVEKYDFRQIDYTNFSFLQLKKRPLCDVSEWKARFPNNKDLVIYPKEWIVMEKESSQVQLSPVEGTFSGLVVTHGGGYAPLLFGTRDAWPHLFQITYTAGFDNDCIPAVINDMIGMQASIRLFEILGDIVIGAGIANENVGLDGANVSKGTTASAMYHAFSARVESYRKQMDDYTKTVRKYYNGFAFTVG